MVDEYVDLAKTLAEWFEQMGHVVRIAHDGPTALQILHDFIPDVVLLDIRMPLMDGYQLARHLRERPELRGVLLVAMSGFGEDDEGARARASASGRGPGSEFADHLLKPVDPEEILFLLLARLPPLGPRE